MIAPTVGQTRMTKTLILMASLFLAACGPTELDGSAIPACYEYLYNGGISYDDVPAIRAALPYEKIQLTRTSGWIPGDGPITLWRSGLAEGPKGTGEVSVWDYGSLCYLIEHLQFPSMQPEYVRSNVMDAGSVEVEVWTAAQDQPKVVREYAARGPIELWGIQTAIDGIASRIEWSEEAQPGDATDGPAGRR